MAFSFFLFGFLSAIFAAVVAPLPLGMPPLPEDPTLLRVAPEDSIVFFEWFGTAKPNPQSPNLTERLASEPEIGHVVSRAVAELHELVDREAGREAPKAHHAIDLAQTVLSRPGCLFLGSVDPRSGSTEAGLVVHLGDAKTEFTKKLSWLSAAWMAAIVESGGGVETGVFDVDGVRFNVLPTPRSMPTLSWTIEGDHFALALGDKTPGTIVAGLRGATGLANNANFKALHGNVAVPRPSFRSYVDLAQVLEMFSPMLGANEGAILGALGLTELRAILTESGLEGTGFVQRSMLAMDKQRGLFKMFDGPTLTKDDLRIVPADATMASVARFAPRRLFHQVLDLVGKIDPNALAELRTEALEPMRKMLGVDLEKDLIDHLGDTIAVWNSPGQGGFLFSGLTVAITLDDTKAFTQSFDIAMNKVAGFAHKRYSDRGRLRRGVYVDQVDFDGRTIWFLDTIDDEMPFTPAWSVTDTHLVMSLFPQMVKATMKPDGASLADTAAAEQVEGTVMFSHANVPEMFDTAYAAFLPIMQIVFAEAQNEGFGMTVADLPMAHSIRRHLRPGTTRVELTERGLLSTHTGTFPWADPLLGLALPIAAMLPSIMYMRMDQGRQRAMVLEERARAEAVRAALEEAKRKAEGKKKKDNDRP